MKIYKLNDFEYWYNRSYHTWYAIRLDAEGNQVGDALFAYSKEQIKLYIEMEYN